MRRLSRGEVGISIRRVKKEDWGREVGLKVAIVTLIYT
jgi:hypothetical protein